VIIDRYMPARVNLLQIGVLANNAPAWRFYESIGGQLVFEGEFDEDGVILPEMVYEWNIDANAST